MFLQERSLFFIFKDRDGLTYSWNWKSGFKIALGTGCPLHPSGQIWSPYGWPFSAYKLCLLPQISTLHVTTACCFWFTKFLHSYSKMQELDLVPLFSRVKLCHRKDCGPNSFWSGASPGPISWGQTGNHCKGPIGVAPTVGLWTGSFGMVCGHRQCGFFVLTH